MAFWKAQMESRLGAGDRGAPSNQYKRVRAVLFPAALYNLIWGVATAVAPVRMLAFLGIAADTVTLEFWQCIGMFVALYGVCYWITARDPARYWPFVAVGLAGKVFGPVGAIVAVTSGKLPAAFLWTNVTNDFIWWVPFGWVLWVILRGDKSRG